MKEEIILVNEQDEELGVMDKMEAHRQGLLHRAFSIFIFNEKGEMLLQQRASSKYHSAGKWSNACCSHPRPGEDISEAASRRLREELGFTSALKKIFQFTYKVQFDNGLFENEVDHVFTGQYNGEIKPNLAEVQNFSFKTLKEIKQSMENNPSIYTEWFLLAFPQIENWMNSNIR
jgi:isopentenyl-diphosphate Delta-isomerase